MPANHVIAQAFDKRRLDEEFVLYQLFCDECSGKTMLTIAKTEAPSRRKKIVPLLCPVEERSPVLAHPRFSGVMQDCFQANWLNLASWLDVAPPAENIVCKSGQDWRI